MNDQIERQQALNPTKSFIVQAPAGSGKTELLTQRFLALLSTVNHPEEILAITFTKKSAAEMRMRIINNLKRALDMNPPASLHAKKTWDLAKQALAQDEKYQWHLLANPNRLRIQTIDSLNASLTKQLPILSQFGAPPDLTPDPQLLYREAIREFLADLEKTMPWSDAIAQLLIHLDNDLNKLEKLLMTMLAKRDQWLPYITLNASDPELRNTLEMHLADVVNDGLATMIAQFPNELADELFTLATFAAQQLALASSDSPICLAPTNRHTKHYWLGIKELLLTDKFDWRKTVNKNQGFPPATQYDHPQEKNVATLMKQRMLLLLEQLTAHPEARSALIELYFLPSDCYTDSQWITLEALHQVLRVLVAQLKLVFQQHGKIDYIENAQAALAALGSIDAPTDLALALDYQIRHILIDEFQDTSTSQYRLIEKLILGWDAHSTERTLFVVGDPMQSIYRFREAEVGLFIRARIQGIGHIKLIPLTLTVNFRSTPTVVNWINQHMHVAFPKTDNIPMGAVQYSPSLANQQEENTASTVLLHPLISDDQPNTIINIIQQEKQRDPNATIAILVRSRSHLLDVIAKLKAENISYRAIDIDPLTTRPVIQDLMALTRALQDPSDRIAWFSILRAPWCGLCLSDLLCLSRKSTIIEQIQQAASSTTLSTDALSRLARVQPILQQQMNARLRHPLRELIETTWLALGGPAALTQQTDQEDAAAYFSLLERLEQEHTSITTEKISIEVKKLFATPNLAADNTLQIMTIHNAKGLEFDTVILPHLERKPAQDDTALLLWMERPRANKHTNLLLAPIHATGESSDSIYHYLKRQQGIKADYETLRLLYVAATRAKQHLHLVYSLATNDHGIMKPAAHSLLDSLWPAIAHQHTDLDFSGIDHHDTLITKRRTIKRLDATWVPPINVIIPIEKYYRHHAVKGFLLPDYTLKHIGTVYHQIMQQVCNLGTTWWQQEHHRKIVYVKKQLLQLGIITTHLNDSIETVMTAIDNTLQDPRGQWIIQPLASAQSEFSLTAVIDTEIHHLTLDRTFVDNHQIRWIIDYKTTAFSGDSLDAFLEAEQEKYAEKMQLYAKALKTYSASHEIRLGLYFPLLPAWREWSFQSK